MTAEENGAALAIPSRSWSPSVLDAEQIDLLRRTIAKDLPADEFALFVAVSKRLGLSPLARQIYGLRVQGRLVVHLGIDGHRALAERSGKYGGQLGPFWADHTGAWTDAWFGEGPPAAAKVGVVRKDWAQPVWAVARFKSYVRESPNWKQQPDVMLAKAAEALALRKAFPQELAGAPGYRPEMEPADDDPALDAAAEEWERLQEARPGEDTNVAAEFAAEYADVLEPAQEPPAESPARLIDAPEAPASPLWPEVQALAARLQTAGVTSTMPPASQTEDFHRNWLGRMDRALRAKAGQR